MSESLVFREFIASEIRDANDDERSFSHPISDESIDAHGSIIKVEGWDLKRFKANPIVLFAHDATGLPIGKSTKVWKEDNRLMTRTQFAGMDQQHPFAETAYKLVRDGFIRAWSVGFVAKERSPREDLKSDEKHQLMDPYIYTKQELMEYSLVPIPSNPHALLGARASGYNLDPLTDWFRQHKQVVHFYAELGYAVPGFESRQEGFEVQSLIFPKKHWKSADSCKSWAKAHDFKAGGIDETDDSYRLRQRDPEDFTRLRTICVNPGDEAPGSESCKVKAVGGPVKKAAPDEMLEEIHQIIIEETLEDLRA